jgi:hypothetical protein
MSTKGVLNLGRPDRYGRFFPAAGGAPVSWMPGALSKTLFVLCAVHEAFHLVTILLLGAT